MECVLWCRKGKGGRRWVGRGKCGVSMWWMIGWLISPGVGTKSGSDLGHSLGWSCLVSVWLKWLPVPSSSVVQRFLLWLSSSPQGVWCSKHVPLSHCSCCISSMHTYAPSIFHLGSFQFLLCIPGCIRHRELRRPPLFWVFQANGYPKRVTRTCPHAAYSAVQSDCWKLVTWQQWHACLYEYSI